MNHSRGQRGPKALSCLFFFSCELLQLLKLYQVRVLLKHRNSSSSQHARRRRAAAHTGGQSCRWYRRRGSYSRQNGQTARREQCSNCKQTRMWPAKPQWGNLTYPSSSGGSPKHAARPPRHGARPLMHEAPLGTCNYPLQLRTPSGGARISKVSTVQFCRLYSLCGSSIALVSLFHRSVANSFDCHDATCSDSLLLPCVQCCLKGCLAFFAVARAVLALQTEPYFSPLVPMTEIRTR